MTPSFFALIIEVGRRFSYSVSDEEWEFVAPYLALLREDAPQRDHDLREVLNGLGRVMRTGSPWCYMPHDLSTRW